MIIIRLNTINLCTNKLLVEILGWGRYMLCTNKWSQYWCIILRTNFVICWWHILQNLDTSLVAKLIKVRYFPWSTLFEAFLSYNPNFAWRSVWKVRHFFYLGVWNMWCHNISSMWESQVNNNRYGSGEILSRSNEPCIVAWTLLILATFIIHLWVGI
jgi:hypothetical protein